MAPPPVYKRPTGESIQAGFDSGKAPVRSAAIRAMTLFRAATMAVFLPLFLCVTTSGAQTPPVPPQSARDLLAAIGKKDFIKARQLLADIRDPLARKALTWHFYQYKESGARFPDLVALLRTTKDWPSYGKLAERAESSIGASEDPELVSAWFKESPPRTRDGWLAAVAALVKLGRDTEADALIKRLWRTVPLGKDDEAFFLRQYARTLTAEDDRERLAMLLRAGRSEDAERLLARMSLAGDDKAAAEARLALQSRASTREQVEEALAKLPAVLRNAPDLRFDEVRWLRRTDRVAEAAAILEQPPADPENSARWAAESNRVVRDLLAEDKFEQAYRTAAGHKQAQGEALASLEFLAGWIALRKRARPGEARPHFVRLHDLSAAAISKARGAYWAARAAQASGDEAESRRWYTMAAGYPHVFYGQLAAAALGRETLALSADVSVNEAALDIFAASELPQAAQFFAALSATEPAHTILVHLANHAAEPREFALVAAFAKRSGIDRIEAAVRASRRAARAAIPLFAAGFPVLDLPAESRIEPWFALALIRQESEFYTAAVSSAGARGLMQLMPATAQQMAKVAKLTFDREQLTTDPDYNIRLGALFLQRLVDRFGGSYALTAAAYNAGPRRVGQWLEKYGDPRASGEWIDWIEAIPFDETRNYVHRVLENLAIYRHRAGLKSLAHAPERLWRPMSADALKLDTPPAPAP
jgi:soluble lytic murein transglycosylase